jgi:hypothetical protein
MCIGSIVLTSANKEIINGQGFFAINDTDQMYTLCTERKYIVINYKNIFYDVAVTNSNIYEILLNSLCKINRGTFNVQ